LRGKMLIEIQAQGKVRSGGALVVEGRSAYFFFIRRGGSTFTQFIQSGLVVL
jgi:hypothetical protein